MRLNVQIRKIKKQDLDFIYKSICELENEILNFEVFKTIFNENISNPKNLYLIAENETEGFGFISFHTQNLLHH
jgi:PhnO protein